MIIRQTGETFETVVRALYRKRAYFDRLKVGDKVRVPNGNRIVTVKVLEKYPYHITALSRTGYKVSFNIGDIVTSVGK